MLLAAMEARSVDEIPHGPEWQYEPKWDGFRCVLARDADDIAMFSKSGQDLKRYFPEIVGAALDLKPRRFVLDGEIVVPIEGKFSFEDLLQRIHPASSRVRTLAAKAPALYLAFDLLAEGKRISHPSPCLSGARCWKTLPNDGLQAMLVSDCHPQVAPLRMRSAGFGRPAGVATA